MEIADAQKFLQENHRACIAVRHRDGWPQMTFVTPGIDSQGRVIITSRGTTYKIKHIRRDPRVSMLIFGEQYSGSKFVQIHGTAEIIEQPEAMDTLIYWYKQVRGEHKNWDEYRDTMKKENASSFASTSKRSVPNRHANGNFRYATARSRSRSWGCSR